MTKFPECPKCKKSTNGVLVPLSRIDQIFTIWRCTVCGYVVDFSS